MLKDNIKIVCLGDSLTHGYKIKKSEAWPALVAKELGVDVVNKGINGDTSGGMLGRFGNDVISERPSHVIIMGGANDLIWGVPLSVVKANMVAMVQQALHNLIVPIIGVPIPFDSAAAMKCWPSVQNFTEINENLVNYRSWIQFFAQYLSVHILDFYSLFNNKSYGIEHKNYIDGIHPTVCANQKMSNLVIENAFMLFDTISS